MGGKYRCAGGVEVSIAEMKTEERVWNCGWLEIRDGVGKEVIQARQHNEWTERLDKRKEGLNSA